MIGRGVLLAELVSRLRDDAMPIDFTAITAPLRAVVATNTDITRPRWDVLRRALATFDDADVLQRLATARTSWLLAQTRAGYLVRFPPAAVPASYRVVATDGSVIHPDRHTPLRYYVLNIGYAMLRYGVTCEAQLDVATQLCAHDDELYITDRSRRVPVTGTVLGIRRAVAELETASRLIDNDISQEIFQETLALIDGTLILWGLEGLPDFVASWGLKPFLAALATFREKRVPVAGFISFPGSSDVYNVLRVAVCDYPLHGLPVNCDHCRARIATEGHRPACDQLPDIPDRELFEEALALQPGERSQVFQSSSRVLDHYPPEDRIAFFYLHTGTEVARVEVPAWVAKDQEILDFVHGVLFDQCNRARGYPLALQEAHEQAVIHAEERETLLRMIEQMLAEHGVFLRESAKQRSKRGRYA